MVFSTNDDNYVHNCKSLVETGFGLDNNQPPKFKTMLRVRYGLWVMGLNARSLAICAWLAWRKPNHRLPIPAFKVGKTDYLTVEYAVEQNQNTGYKNILIL